MSRTLEKLLKVALGVGAIYVAYKVGESMGKDKDVNVSDSPKSELDSEIEFITGLIKDYKDKPNKTKKDRDNLDLLNIKLEQLKKQK
jgi:hypothetical protein